MNAPSARVTEGVPINNTLSLSSLAHLALGRNEIGAEGAGRLAAVLGQCASLAHLDLYYNGIRDEGAGRLAAVAELCPSLTIGFERS